MLLFPATPFEISHADPDFADQYKVAVELGAPCALIDYESLLEGDLPRALRQIPLQDAPTTAVLRGWMLRSEQYRILYDALADSKTIQLINTPDQYAACHELPGWYELMADFTPETLVVPGAPPDIDRFVEEVQQRFSAGGIVVKDYVKSRKHEWLDACFVPDAADEVNLRRVADNFARGQAESLTGGLVARRFAALQSSGVDPQTGRSLPLEWRLFRVGSARTLTASYWHAGQSVAVPEGVEEILARLDTLGSRFYAADIALTEAGEPILIEVGDGQVSDARDPRFLPELVAALAQVA